MLTTVSVVIVNFNGADVLKPCIESILASEGAFLLEIVVVDNASTDNPSSIKDAFGNAVKWIENQQNEGFAKANNQGVNSASGDWVLILNNDTILSKNALNNLLTYSMDHPEVGMVGPLLLNQDGTEQRQGSVWNVGKRGASYAVSFMVGACMLMKRSLYQSLGGFDEAFFFYNEDLDLCKRVRQAGYKLIRCSHATVVHVGGHATQSASFFAQLEGIKGGLYFAKKHYPFWHGMYACLLGVWAFFLMVLPTHRVLARGIFTLVRKHLSSL